MSGLMKIFSIGPKVAYASTLTELAKTSELAKIVVKNLGMVTQTGNIRSGLGKLTAQQFIEASPSELGERIVITEISPKVLKADKIGSKQHIELTKSNLQQNQEVLAYPSNLAPKQPSKVGNFLNLMTTPFKATVALAESPDQDPEAMRELKIEMDALLKKISEDREAMAAAKKKAKVLASELLDMKNPEGAGKLLVSHNRDNGLGYAIEIFRDIQFHNQQYAGQILAAVYQIDSELANRLLTDIHFLNWEYSGPILIAVYETDPVVSRNLLIDIYNEEHYKWFSGAILASGWRENPKIGAALLKDVDQVNPEISGDFAIITAWNLTLEEIMEVLVFYEQDLNFAISLLKKMDETDPSQIKEWLDSFDEADFRQFLINILQK